MNTTKIESHKERKKCSSNYQAYVTSTFTTSNLIPVDHLIFRSFPNAPVYSNLEDDDDGARQLKNFNLSSS